MSQDLTRYGELLTQIKDCIRRAQVKATLSANAEMILMYWDIGRMIHVRQQHEGWGTKVIPQLSRDIRNELPEIKGFSERNLKRMIAFYREYPLLSAKVPQAVAQLPAIDSSENLQQLVEKIPWGHHILLMEKIKDLPARFWYMGQTIEQGWSRNVLGLMIKSNAHKRQGAAVTNFEKRLPDPQSEVMHAVIQSILGNRVDFVQTPIGNICSMKTGKTPPTKQIEYFDGDVLFVCPSDLGKSLKISKSERHLTKKSIADGKANLFKTGTVLLVGIGSTVGKVGIAECDLCTNQQITGIVFNDSVLPEYAVWYLSTQRDVIRNAAAGGGVPIINQQGISQLVIWHPNSIDAQRAIVRKLDALQEKLDELIAEQNSVDEKLATFQSALLAKAFRGEL